MEDIKNKFLKYKYFFYYPKSKDNIKLISKGNDLTELKNKVLDKLIKLDEIPIILIELVYKEKTSFLLPQNYIIKYRTFIKKNNKFTIDKKKASTDLIYLDNEYLQENKFKFTLLKLIIDKIFFKNFKVNAFGADIYELLN